MIYKIEENNQNILIDKIENTINYRSTRAKRLLKSEAFIQHINILYSCFGAFLSVWSLLVDHKSISFMATIISIILVVSITYLNSQRFAARAKDIEANILDLHNLRSELSMKLTKKQLSEKWKIYNSYLAASETEDDYDKLYHDIYEYMPDKNGKKILRIRQFQFFTRLILRMIIKGIIVFLPFIITIFLVYSVHAGSISSMDSLCQTDNNQEVQQEYEPF